MYDDVWLGIGILVMFSFVYIDLGIKASMLLLACVGPAYCIVGIVVYDFVIL